MRPPEPAHPPKAGVYFGTLVFVPSFESCEREGKYSGLVVQPAEPAKAGVYFGTLVFVANF